MIQQLKNDQAAKSKKEESEAEAAAAEVARVAAAAATAEDDENIMMVEEMEEGGRTKDLDDADKSINKQHNTNKKNKEKIMAAVETMLWVNKYAPRNYTDLIGNEVG